MIGQWGKRNHCPCWLVDAARLFEMESLVVLSRQNYFVRPVPRLKKNCQQLYQCLEHQGQSLIAHPACSVAASLHRFHLRFRFHFRFHFRCHLAASSTHLPWSRGWSRAAELDHGQTQFYIHSHQPHSARRVRRPPPTKVHRPRKQTRAPSAHHGRSGANYQ